MVTAVCSPLFSGIVQHHDATCSHATQIFRQELNAWKFAAVPSSGTMILLGSVNRVELERMVDKQLNIDPFKMFYDKLRANSDAQPMSAVPTRLTSMESESSNDSGANVSQFPSEVLSGKFVCRQSNLHCFFMPSVSTETATIEVLSDTGGKCNSAAVSQGSHF